MPNSPNPRSTKRAHASASVAEVQTKVEDEVGTKREYDDIDSDMDDDDASTPGGSKRPRLTTQERLERSRERNRIHARKTRQRKKAQLQNLQEEMEELQRKNQELSQAVNKHMVAIVLLVLRAPDYTGKLLKAPGLEEALGGVPDDDQHEVDGGDSDNGSLNSSVNGSSGSSDSNSSNGNNGQRPRGNSGSSGEGRSTSPETSISSGDMAWGDNSGQVEFSGMPAASNASSGNSRHSCAGDFASLNTLNLGGSSSDNGLDMNGEPKLNGMILGVAEMAQMDIDLELMRKDRSQCTQQELNQIRRERNRMHAKRTRVRKKVQMEEIQENINKLEETNHALSERLAWLGSKSFTVMVEDKSPASIPDNEDDQPDNIQA